MFASQFSLRVFWVSVCIFLICLVFFPCVCWNLVMIWKTKFITHKQIGMPYLLYVVKVMFLNEYCDVYTIISMHSTSNISLATDINTGSTLHRNFTYNAVASCGPQTQRYIEGAVDQQSRRLHFSRKPFYITAFSVLHYLAERFTWHIPDNAG